MHGLLCNVCDWNSELCNQLLCRENHAGVPKLAGWPVGLVNDLCQLYTQLICFLQNRSNDHPQSTVNKLVVLHPLENI